MNEIIGRNLCLLREHAGYTQKNIADFLKVDQSLISKIESGERNISADMLETLSTLYGIMTDEIVKENASLRTLSCAFRCSELTPDEMNAICTINRIALNSELMQNVLEAHKI